MGKSVKEDEFKRYLAEARSWETDKVAAEARSRKVAWAVAIGAAVVACLGVTSTALMALKDPPPPTVLRVNDSTGAVDVLSTLTEAKVSYGETVDKYFSQWYIRYREGYSREIAEEYYSNVGLLSSGAEQQRYYEWFNPKNPKSPVKLYGDYAKSRIVIKSTSFMKSNVALVRYQREVLRGNDAPEISHWVATITFKYSPLPMSEKDRAINPLGFQVVEYRNDSDSADSRAPGSNLKSGE
jgi:type IV secretion system protein VirB8